MVKPLNNLNILVTGGTGFVGSHLVEELVKHNANVISTSLISNPRAYFFKKKLQDHTTLVNLDINDYNSLLEIIVKFQIDYIFHLAAESLVDVSYVNPLRTIKSNILGTANILEITRNYPNVKGVIFASSDKAYGKLSKEKYTEKDALVGDHPYEVSKSSADLICQAYFQTYRIPVVISRFGNIYGEGDLSFSRIIPAILKSIIKKEVLEIRSDGKYIRDFLYVKDVIQGYLDLALNIDKFKGEAFNFGSNETLSVLELIKQIEEITGKKITYKILNNAKNEISYQSLDFSKAHQKLGWLPKWNLAKTIPEILKYYKSVL